MLHIAICEDNTQDALLLKQLLVEYFYENSFDGEVDVYKSAEEMFADFSPGRYQIAFLDIYLTGMDGMEAARRLRDKDKDLALIFLTVSRTHAVESYSVQATYYLEKPVDYDGLYQAMQRCESVLAEYNRYIEVLSNREPVKLFLRDILYIETYQRNSIIYTANEEVRTAMTMDALETAVGGMPFFRCHRGFLINMRKILRLKEKEIIMNSGAHVPVGKTYTDEFKREYTNFAMALARKKQVKPE